MCMHVHVCIWACIYNTCITHTHVHMLSLFDTHPTNHPHTQYTQMCMCVYIYNLPCFLLKASDLEMTTLGCVCVTRDIYCRMCVCDCVCVHLISFALKNNSVLFPPESNEPISINVLGSDFVLYFALCACLCVCVFVCLYVCVCTDFTQLHYPPRCDG
jgi:hypothetical protein